MNDGIDVETFTRAAKIAREAGDLFANKLIELVITEQGILIRGKIAKPTENRIGVPVHTILDTVLWAELNGNSNVLQWALKRVIERMPA
ncbi:MAG: hypothetical protein ABW128_06950 [Rhizorhabdus sp.]